MPIQTGVPRHDVKPGAPSGDTTRRLGLHSHSRRSNPGTAGHANNLSPGFARSPVSPPGTSLVLGATDVVLSTPADITRRGRPRRRIEWERRSVVGPRGCLPQTAPGDSEPWSATVGRHRSLVAYLGSDTDTSRRRRWRVTTTQRYVTGVMVATADDAIFFCRMLFVVGVVIR